MKARYPSSPAPMNSLPVVAIVVLPEVILVLTWQGLVAKQPARMPPTPEAEETKSVSPTNFSVAVLEAIRRGPAPEVPNGTSVRFTLADDPDASRIVTPTPSRWPRAWESSDRPDGVSVKYSNVPPPAPIVLASRWSRSRSCRTSRWW